MQATDLARQMVTKYGMSDVLGQVSIDYEDDGRSLSSETRSTVESEVRLPEARAQPEREQLPECLLSVPAQALWAGESFRVFLRGLAVLDLLDLLGMHGESGLGALTHI